MRGPRRQGRRPRRRLAQRHTAAMTRSMMIRKISLFGSGKGEHGKEFRLWRWMLWAFPSGFPMCRKGSAHVGHGTRINHDPNHAEGYCARRAAHLRIMGAPGGQQLTPRSPVEDYPPVPRRDNYLAPSGAAPTASCQSWTSPVQFQLPAPTKTRGYGAARSPPPSHVTHPLGDAGGRLSFPVTGQELLR